MRRVRLSGERKRAELISSLSAPPRSERRNSYVSLRKNNAKERERAEKVYHGEPKTQGKRITRVDINFYRRDVIALASSSIYGARLFLSGRRCRACVRWNQALPLLQNIASSSFQVSEFLYRVLMCRTTALRLRSFYY